MIDDDILADFENRTKPKTDGEFNSRLEQAKNAYKEKFGKDLPINSTLRNRKEQQDLYNRWKKGEKGIYMPLNPADYPNQNEFHKDAADISIEVPETFLNQYGLHRPLGKNDPVHTILNPNFKSSNFTNVSNTSEDLLNQFEQDTQQHQQYLKNEGLYQPENEWKPGFYNPNLVRQGEAARQAGGGNLQPIVENTAKALGGMSWEDWKKNALTANLLKYGVGSMPIVGDKQMREEGRQKLEEVGKGLYSAVRHPIDTFTALSNLKPEEAIPEMIKGGIYDAPLGMATKPILEGAKFVTNPVTGAINKVATPVVQSAAEKFGNLQEAFQKLKPPTKAQVTLEGANYRPDLDTQMLGVGAANVTKQSAVDALAPNLSPETQSLLKSHPIENVNLPALETKALEEKLGIDLSKGQRINDKSVYANEWNARDTNADIQKRFSNQPQQFADSFERTLDKHASDIGELTKENIGQIQINALANKDKLRISAINKAKQDLVDANGGQFPIDIGKLKENINTQLGTQYKSRYLSDAIKGDLEDFYKNPTFEAYEHVRSNLADEMRTAKDGKSRQAAWIARNEMEKLPIFGEETGSPQAIALKALADKYRSLNVERYNVLKTNPAYKAAVKEATDVAEAESMESLNAAKFHDKYVTNSTPESVRRMVEELKDSPEAIKALKAGDILNARDALVPNTMTPQLKPDMYNKYLRSQAGKAKYVHDAESLQDLLDYGILSSKVAKPSENVFNYSNSYSAYLGDLLKEGLKVTGEGALALKTGGASIIPMNVGKGLYSKYKSNKFAQETTHPHSGLIEEKP